VAQPNFFIVGASRAGTTSLWHFLSQHPDVFMPSKDMSAKEPSFFCDIKPCWAEPYRDLASYLDLFAEADGQRAVGEASTPYLVSPESPQRLRDAYPDARIIAVLRNPAERAYSLYQYLCMLGFERISTFERALEKEQARLNDESFKLNNRFWYYAYLYFTTGLYSAQLERFYQVFPRRQIKVLLYDDLVKDPLRTTQDVYQFLDVDHRFEPKIHHINASGYPLSVWLQYALGHRWHQHPMHEKSDPTSADKLRRLVFKANSRLGALRKISLSPHMRRTLLENYRTDISRTSSIIERDLKGWYA
jgi:hypothetical protein